METLPPTRTSRGYLLPLALLILVGLAVRLPFMPYRGTTDHQAWKIWSYAGATHPIGHLYRLQGDERPPLTPAYIKRTFTGLQKPAKWLYGDRAEYVEYPPIAPLLLALVGRAYIMFSPEFEDTPALNALVKLPGLLADIGITLLIFFLAGRLYSRKFGLAAAALFWLNPMAILNGPLLGYLDPIYSAFLIVSVVLFSFGRHAWGWSNYALALLTKPQPIVALPVFVVASIARRSLPRLAGYVATTGASAFIVILPFLIGSTVIGMIANNLRQLGQRYLSANSCNIWWLASYAKDWHDFTARGVDRWQATNVTTQIHFIPDLVAAGLPDPRPWGIGFFLIFTVAIVAAWWSRFGRSEEARAGLTPAIAEVAALQIFGATMLLTQIHENHAYGAAALLGVAWWLDRRSTGRPDRELLALYVCLSATVFLNIFLFYGLGTELGEQVVRRDILWFDLTVLTALANLGIFGWWLVRWIRPTPLFSRSPAPARRAATYTEEARSA
jgi:hypothetical protein